VPGSGGFSTCARLTPARANVMIAVPIRVAVLVFVFMVALRFAVRVRFARDVTG